MIPFHFGLLQNLFIFGLIILLAATIFPVFVQTGYILMQKNYPKSSALNEAIWDISFIEGVKEVKETKIFNLDGVTKVATVKVIKDSKSHYKNVQNKVIAHLAQYFRSKEHLTVEVLNE